VIGSCQSNSQLVEHIHIEHFVSRSLFVPSRSVNYLQVDRALTVSDG
jgi:hypothetical protein